MRVKYSIIYVSDMAASVTFYRDVVGMPLRFESPAWTEFNTEGATWALHLSEKRGDTSGEPSPEVPGSCRPGFQVQDLDGFHARMVGSDVRCVQPPTETFGTRVAQYVDPDGLVFSVGEAMPAK